MPSERYADATFRSLYNRIRPALPRKWGVINGVAVRDFRLFDRQDHQPDVMAGLISEIRENVRPDDLVVDVATGRGIAAVWAARSGGRVRSYEASQEYVQIARETVKASDVDEVRIQHAVVGTHVHVWGDIGSAETILPAELPECDVLQLDCEGTEIEILSNLDQRPRTVIVETHPVFDAPPEDVREILVSLGYDVEERVYEDPESDKKVLVAAGYGHE